MPTRYATHILKNSDIVNRPLPSTLLKGEAIVNTADGIVYFSGTSQSTNQWTPAGTGTTANFFEVGSNLYDLQLRHRITKYDNVSGAGLVGMFLSGTSAGFVLAPISSISGVDTYVTGFTYSNNIATIYQNLASPLSILINSMTGLTVNGVLSASTANLGAANISTLNATAGTITTLGSTTINVNNLNATAGTINNLVSSNLTANTANITTITGINSLSATSITATTFYGNGSNITGLPYVTGGTVNRTSNNTTLTFTNSTGGTFNVATIVDTFTTGGTYSAGTLSLTNNSGNTFTVTGLTSTDTFVTGFTYSNNLLTIYRNQGQPNLSVLINTMTGLTVSGTLSTNALSATTANLGTATVTNLTATTATIPTLNTTNEIVTNLTATTATIPTLNATNEIVTNLTATTANLGIVTITTLNATNEVVTNLTATTATIPTLVTTNLSATTVSATTYLNLPLDIRVTGGTPNNSTKTYTFTNNTGGTFNVTALTDITVTGGTYSGGNATFTNNTGGTFTVTGLTSTDTFVSAFTYNNNVLTIKQTQGQPDLSVLINTMTGLTVNGILSATTGNIGLINTSQLNATGGTVTTLNSTTINAANVNISSALTPTYMTANRFVFTNSGGTMVTGNAIFDGVNATLPPTGSLTVGTGGITIGSGGSPSVAGTGDLIVNGNLTVFGGSVSAFTSQLYVEDPNVIFNFNPTGSTVVTSICAGLTIQDGSGISGSSVGFSIQPMNLFSGIVAGQVPNITEYTGADGYANRAWITQLNDIVIRSTTVCPANPNGVRVLAEFDVLDGGSY